MFSVEEMIKQEFGLAKRIIYGWVQHSAISGAAAVDIDYREQGAVGILILGVTYTTELTTAVTSTIMVNADLYLSYAAITPLAGYIPSVHFVKNGKMTITCSEAKMVGTIDYQIITLE